LAAAGIWSPWPTGQFFAIAAFNFPVPKNEFVDLMVRTNDTLLDDPRSLYGDEAARRALLEMNIPPAMPGGLASAQSAIAENDIYDTERLRLIFYDNPFWGKYHRRLARIFREPRYFDLRENLRYFAAAYHTARKRVPAAHRDRTIARFL